MKPYRVVVWATGRTGKALLRNVISRPDIELAGVLVYSPDKDGVDAGDLVGMPETGVRATTDKQRVPAIDADVVCMAPKGNNQDDVLDADVLGLLEAGHNVISTRGYQYPYFLGAEYVEKFEKACQVGGSSLLCIGNNPGFLGKRLLTTLTGGCLSIDHLSLVETYDASRIDVSTSSRMGFGSPPEAFAADPIVPAYRFLYSHTLHFVCDTLGRPLHRVDHDVDLVTAERDVEGTDVEVRAGTISAIHLRWKAIVDDTEFFTMENRWFVGQAPEGWDRTTGWTLRTRGEPPFVLRLGYDGVPPDVGSKAFLPALFLNAIPLVVDAGPGQLTPTVFAPYSDRRTRP